jgi:hypothetical protein
VQIVELHDASKDVTPDGTATPIQVQAANLKPGHHLADGRLYRVIAVPGTNGIRIERIRSRAGSSVVAVWSPARGLRALTAHDDVRAIIENPASTREAYARVTGRCGRCNKPVSNPASVHRGMGSECWARAQGRSK